MSFLFNGQIRPWCAELSVQELLRQEGYGLAASGSSDGIRLGVAVAINEQVLPRSSWVSSQIARDDRVELFQAIAGG